MRGLLTGALLGLAPVLVSGEDLSPPAQPLADRVEEVIKPAKDEFLKAKTGAQERYRKALDAELEKATKAGSLDDVNALRKEMEEYVADDSKWKSATHKAAIKKYNAELDVAGKKFFTALDALMKEQVRKKNIDVANRIKEMKDAGLEGIRAPAEGGWVNLMAVSDPARFTVRGKWEMKEGRLTSDATTDARLELPYQPPDEYDFQVKFTRLQGQNHVALILAKEERQFAWLLGHMENKIFGFEFVDGKWANGNDTSKPGALQNGRIHVARVEVRKKELTAYFDGAKVVQYKTTYDNMSLFQGWKLNNSTTLGIGSKTDPTVFYEVLVRDVTGAGKRLR
jgi:hypothetical protein